MATFQLKKFDQLTSREIHSILLLRAKVFVVEQNCAYQDPDALDLESEHLLMNVMGKFAGCSRLFLQEGVVKIGRVVVDPEFRAMGLGKALMNESVRVLKERKIKEDIVIHAQYRLLKFYQNLGFEGFGNIFLEDGIEHIKMKYG